MASLLVAPVKRSSIVLGKVFALMTVSGISSIIYVGGMVACTPFMMDSMAGMEDALNLRLDPSQIVMLGLLLIALAFLYSAVVGARVRLCQDDEGRQVLTSCRPTCLCWWWGF